MTRGLRLSQCFEIQPYRLAAGALGTLHGAGVRYNTLATFREIRSTELVDYVQRLAAGAVAVPAPHRVIQADYVAETAAAVAVARETASEYCGATDPLDLATLRAVAMALESEISTVYDRYRQRLRALPVPTIG